MSTYHLAVVFCCNLGPGREPKTLTAGSSP
jgi:hypothetical protein